MWLLTFTNRGKKTRGKKWTTPISFVDIYEEVRKPLKEKNRKKTSQKCKSVKEGALVAFEEEQLLMSTRHRLAAKGANKSQRKIQEMKR